MNTSYFNIVAITPTNVGNGERYTRLDYVWQRGTLYILDIGRVTARLTASGTISVGELVEHMKAGSFLWDDILRQAKVDPADVADYAIPSASNPATGGAGERQGEVHALVRDADRRPYIPGSSVKGAIRSALVWQLLKAQTGDDISRKVGQGRKEFAANQIERDLLGRDPNHDLLRALRVSDSTPFALADVQIVEVARGKGAREGAGISAYVEALRPGATAVLQISLDDVLLDNLAAQLGWTKEQTALLREGLDNACRDFAAVVIEEQAKFYHPTWQEHEGDGSFTLALGWGTGWASKAPAGLKLMKERPNYFEQIADNLRMGKRDVYISTDTFPTSHWMPTQGDAPLGWVRLSPTEVRPALPKLSRLHKEQAALEVAALPHAAVRQPPPRQQERTPSGPTYVPAERVRYGSTITGTDLRYDWRVRGEIIEVNKNFLRIKIKSATDLQGKQMHVSDEPIGIMHKSRFADPAAFHPDNYLVGQELTATYHETDAQVRIQLRPTEGAALQSNKGG